MPFFSNFNFYIRFKNLACSCVLFVYNCILSLWFKNMSTSKWREKNPKTFAQTSILTSFFFHSLFLKLYAFFVQKIKKNAKIHKTLQNFTHCVENPINYKKWLKTCKFFIMYKKIPYVNFSSKNKYFFLYFLDAANYSNNQI